MLNKIYQWILPSVCLLCAADVADDLDLCQACNNDLPRINQACYCCALPLAGDINSRPLSSHLINKSLPSDTNNTPLCGHCLKIPRSFNRTIALCSYEEPIISFINQMKFLGQLKYARLFNHLLIHHLAANQHYLRNLPECIIPVPLHPQRLKERGFNQALELSRLVAAHFNIPIKHDACQRLRATTSQSLIHATHRQSNMKNAFALTKSFSAKHIAIVDDVVTTGSTVEELSQLFRNNGVEQIDIWCCARTALQFPAQHSQISSQATKIIVI